MWLFGTIKSDQDSAFLLEYTFGRDHLDTMVLFHSVIWMCETGSYTANCHLKCTGSQYIWNKTGVVCFSLRVDITRHAAWFCNQCMWFVCLFCFSGRIPRLLLNQHSLYVRVVEKTPPPPLTREQYGKMKLKYPEGGHCQSVLRPQGVFDVHLYFK